ncbi:DAM1 [Phaffia rhodozyma]|uniref:DASH complex subunit DAM1 n=1 Tax=Phaffia rhodozyma TaxID=264483 RepID=A0A0F7SM76_PHARH|nr:DAM1 [Phaffia rhodozyma]
MPTTHHTPLRRISQGSLRQSYLSSSGSNHGHMSRYSTSNQTSLPLSHPSLETATLGLDHLASSFAELTDELDTLHQNNCSMVALSRSLAEFNEGFAGFLFGLRMNAFSVEFPQAPSDLSYEMHANRPMAHSTAPAPSSPNPASPSRFGSPVAKNPAHPADMTYMTQHSQYSFANEEEALDNVKARAAAGGNTRGGQSGARGTTSAGARGRGARGRGRGGTSTGGAAARKLREAKISSMMDTLPLEFRGSQPALTQAMERVISSLMNSPTGLKMADLVKSDLPQIKVNRCLIALVGKKVVVKINEGGVTNYQLVG